MEKEEEKVNEMSFLDHLVELRKRIIWSFVALAVTSILSAVFINDIMNLILLEPASRVHLDLQNLKPFGQPFLYFKVILLSGIILAFPLWLYQLWKFIAPGLYENERGWASKITVFTSVCFMTGVAFSYFVMVPSMLSFAASFGTDKIKNTIDVNEYFGFLTMIMLASGIVFEMPMVSFILSKIGILNPKMLRKYWRHSVVVILIIAAVATPTPDPISQLIFAAPLFVLYEISIWVSKIAYKSKEA